MANLGALDNGRMNLVILCALVAFVILSASCIPLATSFSISAPSLTSFAPSFSTSTPSCRIFCVADIVSALSLISPSVSKTLNNRKKGNTASMSIQYLFKNVGMSLTPRYLNIRSATNTVIMNESATTIRRWYFSAASWKKSSIMIMFRSIMRRYGISLSTRCSNV